MTILECMPLTVGLESVGFPGCIDPVPSVRERKAAPTRGMLSEGRREESKGLRKAALNSLAVVAMELVGVIEKGVERERDDGLGRTFVM
jgi:hypothetical protein